MTRYLLFDSGCSVCTGVARLVEEKSNGRLTLRSLHDPEMQAILNTEKKEWKWESTLIEASLNRFKVFTGLPMRIRLLNTLGIRRSLDILCLLANSTISPSESPRRSFIKRAVFIAASGVLGPVIIPQVAHANRTKSQPGAMAQKEGVRSYKFEDKADGLYIHFTHKDPSRSGTVIITGLQNPQATASLFRTSFIFAFTADRLNSMFTVTDNTGRRGTFVFAERQWNSNDINAKAIVEQNTADVTLTAAIYGDFEVPPIQANSDISSQDMSTSESQNAVSPMVSCPCSTGGNSVRGTSGASGYRSVACENATNNANTRCTNRFCFGCCRLLPSCDCACLVADYLCACGRIGYYCTGGCA